MVHKCSQDWFPPSKPLRVKNARAIGVKRWLVGTQLTLDAALPKSGESVVGLVDNW